MDDVTKLGLVAIASAHLSVADAWRLVDDLVDAAGPTPDVRALSEEVVAAADSRAWS